MKKPPAAALNGFQSTLPAWGATISIIKKDNIFLYFNPRSPHGERQHMTLADLKTFLFQSTLPAWGATVKLNARLFAGYDFNPRSPHGERQ